MLQATPTSGDITQRTDKLAVQFAQTPYPGQEGKDINAQSSSAAHQLSDINTYSKQ